MKASIALMLAISLLATGCMTTRHYVSSNTIQGTRAVKTDNDYFISGLAQKKETSAAHVCGGIQRVAATETKHSALNYLLGIVTFGIYTPQEQTIYCR
ncbi:MAG: Bor family protein [Rickettsiales bacterium]|nr:Bor family protein [Rickettsiales bacterium]